MPPKRRVDGSIAIPAHISQRAASRLAVILGARRGDGAAGSSQRVRHSIRDALSELTSGCSESLELPLSGGGVYRWPTMNFQRMLQQLCEKCEGMRSVMLDGLARRPGDHQHPWHIALYADEVVPGNVLSPDNRRKVMAFYATFRELGWAVTHEQYWLPLAVLRREVASQVLGGWSAVVRALLRPLLLGPLGMPSAGVTVCLPEPRTVIATFGNMLADEAALHAAWDCKGSAGLFPCMACRNVTSISADLVANDPTGTLVTVACADATRLQHNTDQHVWGVADQLQAMAGTMTKQAFVARERVFGMNHSPHGLLSDVSLRPVVGPVTTLTFDPMHVFLVSGIAALELHLLVETLKSDMSISYPQLADACRAPWRWPPWVDQCCIKAMFDERRAKHNQGTVRSSASEMLAVYPIIRHFLEVRVLPSGAAVGAVQSWMALCKVLDLLVEVKHRFTADKVRKLARAISQHLDLFTAVHGASQVKPKHHMAMHIPMQLLRDGCYMDCFTQERKNKIIKAAAGHQHQTDARFEKGVLDRVVASCQEHLQQPLPQGLVSPVEPAPAWLADALGCGQCMVSARMQVGQHRLGRGALLFRHGRAFLVEACVELPSARGVLCVPMTPGTSPSDWTTTWVPHTAVLEFLHPEPPWHTAHCWKQAGGGAILALSGWRP